MIRLVAVVTIATGLTLAGGSVAAQDASCTDVSVGHGGIELLTRGPVSIGPIAISLPAGTYRLIMTSADPGHMPNHQENQVNERWNFVLDNGYSSPITPDLATELTTATYDMGVADLAAASSLTFIHHGVAPSADSVYPSVVFQCVAPPPTTTTAPPTTEPPVTVADTSTTAAPTTTPPPTAPTTAPPTSEGEVNSEELPRTGTTTNLLLLGLGLAAAGTLVLEVSRCLNSVGATDD